MKDVWPSDGLRFFESCDEELKELRKKERRKRKKSV